MRFLRDLHQNFEPKRQKLLTNRKFLQYKIDTGDYYPDFDPKTANIRNDFSWKASTIPTDMLVCYLFVYKYLQKLFF